MTEIPNRPARPWDIFNKNLNNVAPSIIEERLSICEGCEFFVKATLQCKKCGCFMDIKTKLLNAECPVGKWGTIQISMTEEQ
jgi:hypothetical protein